MIYKIHTEFLETNDNRIGIEVKSIKVKSIKVKSIKVKSIKVKSN
ncbi:MAG: hypothetical protein OEX98_07520 [Nitrosopumilus sp.]|nr:hypothetical protein [Nitrosopumilus sp.]